MSQLFTSVLAGAAQLHSIPFRSAQRLSVSQGKVGASKFMVVGRVNSTASRSSLFSLASNFDMRNSRSSADQNRKIVTATGFDVITAKQPSANGDKDQASAAIKVLKEKINCLETLTVQELREIMRKLEIPTKGRKEELTSTLKSFLASQGEILDTETHSEAIAMRRKIEKPSTVVEEKETQTFSEKVGTLKMIRGRKRASLQNAVEEDDSKAPSADEESLKRTAGMRVALSKRKTAVKIQKKSSELVESFGIAVNENEPWTVLAHKKPQPEWVPYNPRTMRRPPPSADTRFLKLMSWNVNGLRALLKLEGFSLPQLAQKEDFDVLCLQETKLQEKDVEDFKHVIEGYDSSFWICSVTKLGYSGTAVISRIKPHSVKYGLGISDQDGEGRLITVEFDSFYLISGYVPNSGDGLKRLPYRINEWDPSLGNYMKDLEKSKPVILTGDLNCAHEEIDIYNPAGNRRSAGFTTEERESFEKNFLSKGFVDTFRRQHPGVVGYTYWGYRHGGRRTNKGWRLDYFLVSESLADKVHDSYILPEVLGSDHCPIGLILKL